MMLNSADSAWRQRAQSVLPNGMYGHLSTRMLPEGYPQFFSGGAGAILRDVDGNEYIDYMCAFGPNLFGYADPEIDAAYIAQLRTGDTLTGPSPLIVELAEALVGQVSHAEWALFCKNGTDATTAAVMTARAVTGRSVILRAHGAYHGAAPWCTPTPRGTVEGDRSKQAFFTYNDVESLKAAVAEAGPDLAAIIANPLNQNAFVPQELPSPEYARAARRLCDDAGALLIADEIRTGFRVSRDSVWEGLDAAPDLSAWGKVLANGRSLSALLGNAKARPGVESIFVTGSFWFASAPMAAAMVVMNRIRETPYLEDITHTGTQLRTGLDEIAARHGADFLQTGPVTMPLMTFTEDPDFRAGFFWCAEMLKRGIYMHPWHNMFINTAMEDRHVEATLKAADGAFAALAEARATLPPNALLASAASAPDPL